MLTNNTQIAIESEEILKKKTRNKKKQKKRKNNKKNQRFKEIKDLRKRNCAHKIYEVSS